MASPVPPLELPELHLEPSAASTEFESADESLASARGSLTGKWHRAGRRRRRQPPPVLSPRGVAPPRAGSGAL